MDTLAVQAAHHASVDWTFLRNPAWLVLMLAPVLIATLLIRRRAVMLRHPLGAFWVGVLACCAAHVAFIASFTLSRGESHVLEIVTIAAYLGPWAVALASRTIKFDIFAVLCILVWPLPLFAELLGAGMILSG